MSDPTRGHTAGPWLVQDEDLNNLVVVQGDDGTVIADVLTFFGVNSPSEAEANAALIAAAPDLKAEVVLLRDYVRRVVPWLSVQSDPQSRDLAIEGERLLKEEG